MKTKSFWLTALALAFFATLGFSHASAAVFSDGDFETQPAQPPWQLLSIGAWGTNHGPIPSDPPQVGSYYAELGIPVTGLAESTRLSTQ